MIQNFLNRITGNVFVYFTHSIFLLQNKIRFQGNNRISALVILHRRVKKYGIFFVPVRIKGLFRLLIKIQLFYFCLHALHLSHSLI